MPGRAAIITISTSKAAGQGHDESGEQLAELARRMGSEIVGRELIADEQRSIEERLRHWADVERCQLILTSGGTGFAPTDVTPEATRAVIEREAPGISHAMREASREYTRHWMLDPDHQLPRQPPQHRPSRRGHSRRDAARPRTDRR